MDVTKVLTKYYEKAPLLGGCKNKPSQTEFHPHRIYACFNFLLWEVVWRKLCSVTV
jgi:hypothetical protein